MLDELEPDVPSLVAPLVSSSGITGRSLAQPNVSTEHVAHLWLRKRFTVQFVADFGYCCQQHSAGRLRLAIGDVALNLI